MAFGQLRHRITEKIVESASEYLQKNHYEGSELCLQIASFLDRLFEPTTPLMGRLFCSIGEASLDRLHFENAMKSFRAAYQVYKRCPAECNVVIDRAIVLRQMSALLRSLGKENDALQFSYRAEQLTKASRKELERCYFIQDNSRTIQ